MAVALGSVGVLASSVAMSVSPASAASAPTTPDTIALAGALADQTLTWGACDFTVDGNPTVEAQLENWANLSCSDVQVPLDWHNPTNGKTLRVKISKITNVDQSSPDYKGTLLVNPGGPGGSALHWAPNVLRRGPQLTKNFNVIGMDPRGVGQSQAPSCTFEAEATITVKEFFKAQAEACSTDEEVTKITTEQTAYDIDFIRGLLEVPKITYIGYSYGTWLGKWYGTLFGPRIERMILDSSLSGLDKTLERSWNLQPVARHRQFIDAMVPYTIRENQRLAQSGEENAELYLTFPTDQARLLELYYTAQNYFIRLGYGDQLVYMWLNALGAFPDPSQYPAATEIIDTFVLNGMAIEQLEGMDADADAEGGRGQEPDREHDEREGPGQPRGASRAGQRHRWRTHCRRGRRRPAPVPRGNPDDRGLRRLRRRALRRRPVDPGPGVLGRVLRREPGGEPVQQGLR